MNRAALFATSFAVLWLITSAVFMAGPLDPPAGPVAPAYKTLSEVEPRIAINSTNTPGDNDSVFKITQPGSYYFIGNITGVAGKYGIEIAVSGVSLDLNGFDLVGAAAMGAFDGVTVSIDQLRGITVRNGTVRGWDDAGVDLGFVSYGCLVKDVRVRDNAGMGINGGVAPSRIAQQPSTGSAASGPTIVRRLPVVRCTSTPATASRSTTAAPSRPARST